jgi:hypothetical protein
LDGCDAANGLHPFSRKKKYIKKFGVSFKQPFINIIGMKKYFIAAERRSGNDFWCLNVNEK